MNHIIKYNVFESFAYENGCIMLELPISNWDEILSIINEEDIYDVQGGKIPFGLQKRAHLTLLYPIKKSVAFDEVKSVLDKVFKDEPINLVTKKIEVFEGTNYDILVIKVEDNPYLKKIHYYLSQHIHNYNRHSFNPHITIGYIKKGTGDKYCKDLRLEINGIDTITYSNKGEDNLYKVNESIYDLKFTDDESNQWVKLMNQYKDNFDTFIGFLISDIFDKYDIDELTKSNSGSLERGPAYWYGPHFTLGDGKVDGIIINIEQLESEMSKDIFTDLKTILKDLERLTGLRVGSTGLSWYNDRDHLKKFRIKMEFDLDPYFDLGVDKLMKTNENKMWYKTIPEMLNFLKSKSDLPWLWLDTETTGLLGPKQEQLTQVSALATNYDFNSNSFDEIGSFDEKIKLTSELKKRYNQPDGGNRRILSFNHYGSGGYKYKEERQIVDEFFDWINEFSPCLLIAQNAGFDMQMLSGRYGHKIKNEVLDTKMLIQLYFLPLIQKLAETNPKYKQMVNGIGTSTRDNGLISSSMSKIGPALGINMSGYHDALTDCRITIQMYQKIVDLLDQHKNLDISKYQTERIKSIRTK